MTSAGGIFSLEFSGTPTWVAELVDALDLKSSFPQRKYGFNSRPGYIFRPARRAGFVVLGDSTVKKRKINGKITLFWFCSLHYFAGKTNQMRKIAPIAGMLLFVGTVYGQDLKFDTPSPYYTNKEKQDKTIQIPFKLDKATKDCDVTIEIVDAQKYATKDKDFSLSTDPVKLTKDNKYSGKLDVVIKKDDLSERNEKEFHLKFTYKNDSDKSIETEYIVIIAGQSNGGTDDPHYTEKEKEIIRNLSFEVYTGGNLDFFDGLKFQNIGGEFIVTANDITGSRGRLGGFFGVSNFQNFSFDSSNQHVRTENIRIDTGTYISGTTKYIRRTFVDHLILSTNQWSYYVNPTYRLNRQKSDFFNIYLSVRLEALRTSTRTEFKTDTLNFTDTTSQPLGASPVFQSGNGFLLQKIVNVQTNGFFSIGFPMFLNAKDKFKLYFDPNLGVTTYTYTTYQPGPDRTSFQKFTYDITKAFYLFRARVTEQFSGLNITIGGEIRGILPSYTPSINAYLGIRADISKWFSKAGPK